MSAVSLRRVIISFIVHEGHGLCLRHSTGRRTISLLASLLNATFTARRPLRQRSHGDSGRQDTPRHDSIQRHVSGAFQIGSTFVIQYLEKRQVMDGGVNSDPDVSTHGDNRQNSPQRHFMAA